jgi:hypothetical protein
MLGWHAIAGFLVPSLVMPELIRPSEAVVKLPIPGMNEVLCRVEEDNRLGNMLVCPTSPQLRNRDVLMALLSMAPRPTVGM